jgi:glycosyltransferase involved in cell wall biosynthesis
MRILMISPQFKPLVGGYERACERLAVALAARGHEVTVCAERRDKAWPQQDTLDGVRVWRWWCVYRPGWHVVTSLLGLAVFLLRHGRGFQVWHVHQYGMHAALALVLGKLLRRPVVLKLTSSSYMGLAQTLASGRCRRLLAALHRRLDAIVALTRETAAEAEAFGIPSARIHVLGNGVDTRAFRPVTETERRRLRQALGLADTSVVIFVGRLSDEKNVSALLRAWAEARPKMAGAWTLVVVGDGPLRQELEAEAQSLTLGVSVRFVGQQANVAEWLAAASIYVLSSDREGLSNTLLEAMAIGLPLAVTRVSGAPELVEETGSGRVVPVGDTGALAAALRELAGSEPLRQEMGSRGRQVIEERYAVDHVAALHEELYDQLGRMSGANRSLTKETC